MLTNHITLLALAHWLSEMWWEKYCETGSLYARTRAVVVYDRAITGMLLSGVTHIDQLPSRV